MNARAVGYWAVSVFACLVTLACGEEKCSRGEPCDEACAAGQTALCVVDGICRCTEAPDGGAGGGQGTGGGSGSGNSVTPPEGCDAPEPGNLIINEVLVDSVSDSGTDEFVEVVNVTEAKIALGGLKVTTTKPGDAPVEEDRWTVQSGCIAARSSVVLFKDKTKLPETSSPAVAAVAATAIGGGLRNSGDLDMHLLAGATEIDHLFAEDSAWVKGVSVNRSPDLTPGTAARHTAVAGASTTFSPGACANGGTFGQLCRDGAAAADGGMGGMGGAGGMGGGGAGGQSTGGTGGGGAGGMVVPPPLCDIQPAPLPAVVINEVLANTDAAQTQEFVEIVNTTEQAVPMDGWVFTSITGTGTFAKRLTIGTGLLPPRGAVAIFGDLTPDHWVWDPLPDTLPTVTQHNWSLIDDGDPLTVKIADSAGVEVATIDVPKDTNKEGKSANRCHDVDGTTLRVHDSLSGAVASPGKCMNDRSFSAGCDPPAPGSMP